MTRVSILGALAFAAVLALGPLGAADYEPIAATDYALIGADAEPFRASFNADAGKVRILMLVAPT